MNPLCHNIVTNVHMTWQILKTTDILTRGKLVGLMIRMLCINLDEYWTVVNEATFERTVTRVNAVSLSSWVIVCPAAECSTLWFNVKFRHAVYCSMTTVICCWAAQMTNSSSIWNRMSEQWRTVWMTYVNLLSIHVIYDIPLICTYVVFCVCTITSRKVKFIIHDDITLNWVLTS